MYRKILSYDCCFTSGIKHYAVVAAVLLLRGAIPVAAQENPWFFGLHTRSYNMYIGLAMANAQNQINSAIAHATDGVGFTEMNVFSYRWVSLTDNGETVDYQRTPAGFGFKAYDLWNDIEAGLKGGWQGAQSPIGVYAYIAYGHNQYKLRFPGEHEYSKHKLHSFRFGVGTRISPLKFLLEGRRKWCPVVELGTTYIKNFSYKGPYGGDIDQINDGIRTSFALGAQIGGSKWKNSCFLVCVDVAQYDLFNRDYTPDGGFWFPYANVRSKDWILSLRYTINMELFDD